MSLPTPGTGGTEAPPVCPRHPDRESWVRCQRCDRPVCPECQREAAVGVQCVDCVQQAARSTPTLRTAFGGRLTGGRPVVTITVVVLCVAVHLLQRLPGVGGTVTFALAYEPRLTLVEPWRLLTVSLVHSPGGFLPFHLLLNMYALWILGQFLEPHLGRARFAALFVVSTLGGSVAYELIVGSGWVVGASGAVFGLFGATLVAQRRLGLDSGPLFVLLAINAVFGFVVPGIAWQAHLGGLITGLVCGAALAYAPRRGRRALQWGALAGVTAVLLILAVVGALVVVA